MGQGQLTEPEVQAIFGELETLHAPLRESEAIQGLEYFRQQLMLTTARQDRALELKIKVLRALTHVQEKEIYARSLANSGLTGQEKTQAKASFTEWNAALRVHQQVYRAVSAVASALAAKARDIKALVDVVVKQMRLGEEGGVNPEEAPELLQPVDLAAVGTPLQTTETSMTDDTPVQPAEYFEQVDQLATMATEPAQDVPPDTSAFQAPVLAQEPEPSRGEELQGLFTGTVTTPLRSPATQTASLNAPLNGADVPRFQVPETRAIPIEVLLQERKHGGDQKDPAYPAL